MEKVNFEKLMAPPTKEVGSRAAITDKEI